MADRLTDLYQDLLTGSYDCVDRIILNRYFRMAHYSGWIPHVVAEADWVGRYAG